MIEKNKEKISQMFDTISKDYDHYNNLISFFTHKSIKKKAIEKLNIKPNSRILDLCCGSGDLGQIIKNKYPQANIIGLDISQQMLEIAKIKNNNITYILGDATNLPFENNSFDFVVMGFGLRNIEDRTTALKEIFRVLDKNGKFLQLDFGERNLITKIYDLILLLIISIFLKNKQSYIYLIKSKAEFIKPKNLIKECETIGFLYQNLYYLLFKIISFQIFIKS